MGGLGLACALGAGLLNSTVPFIFRRESADISRQAGLMFWGLVLTSAAAWAIASAWGLSFGGWTFVAAAAASGALMAVNSFTYLGIVIHRGPMAISWAVVWTSAVCVAALGWVFLGEPVLAGQPAGLACFVGCLAVMAAASRLTSGRGGDSAAIRRGYWPWLMVSFSTGVASTFLMKAKDLWPPVGHSVAFVAVSAGAAAAALAVMGLASGRGFRTDRRTVSLGALYAAVLLANLVVLLEGLSVSVASVFFPVMAGVAILSGTALAALGGERPSRLVYAGSALAVLAIILVNVGRPL